MRKFICPEFVFGKGSRTLVGQYAKNFGAHRALIVSDKNLQKFGWVSEAQNNLEYSGVQYSTFLDVTPNPRVEEIERGADFYLQQNCNLLIAIGGGSVIDCAKGIGVVVTNKKPIRFFEGVDKVFMPIPPLICIPTTAGTSADVSQFAIIADLTERVKFGLISKIIVPDISLIDPETTLTVEPYVVACTGMDALSHAIEAYVSLAHSAITDVHALSAIKLISENLPKLMLDLNNTDLRSQIALASLQAGLAFSNAILGAVHAMAHSLGGYSDAPHGECNSVLMPHVIDFNFKAAPERFTNIGTALGLPMSHLNSTEKKNAIVAKILTLRKEVGIDKKLTEMGITRSDLSFLSDNAVRDICLFTNPREAKKKDIEVIYEEAL